MVLPAVILVRICIVGNAADDDARELGRDPGRFHLEAEYIVYVTSSRVSLCRTPHNSISGSDQSVLYLGPRKLSRPPTDSFHRIAVLAGRTARNMGIVRFKEDVIPSRQALVYNKLRSLLYYCR